jgi:hypothetical protein
MAKNGNFVNNELFSEPEPYDSDRNKAIAEIATTKNMREDFAASRSEVKANLTRELNTFFKDTDGYNSDEMNDEIPENVIDDMMDGLYGE